MDLEATLLDAGYDVAGPAATVKEALGILENSEVDLALLDINLGRENSFSIAEALSRLKRPFLFLTGYSEGSEYAVPEQFSQVKRIGKPLKYDELLSAIKAHG